MKVINRPHQSTQGIKFPNSKTRRQFNTYLQQMNQSQQAQNANNKPKKTKKGAKKPGKIAQFIEKNPTLKKCSDSVKTVINNPVVKKVGKVSWNIAKKIRPGHLMFGMMLVMTCLSRCSTGDPARKSAAEYLQWAYDCGEQRVRDSIRIADLEKENKLFNDSIKALNKNLPKVIKK